MPLNKFPLSPGEAPESGALDLEALRAEGLDVDAALRITANVIGSLATAVKVGYGIGFILSESGETDADGEPEIRIDVFGLIETADTATPEGKA